LPLAAELPTAGSLMGFKTSRGWPRAGPPHALVARRRGRGPVRRSVRQADPYQPVVSQSGSSRELPAGLRAGAVHRRRAPEPVKVLVSIGGGGAHPYYDLLKDEKRAMFIERLTSAAMKYNVDGIDVDLDGSDIRRPLQSVRRRAGESAQGARQADHVGDCRLLQGQPQRHRIGQYDFSTS
jgi:hypothetical protein